MLFKLQQELYSLMLAGLSFGARLLTLKTHANHPEVYYKYEA